MSDVQAKPISPRFKDLTGKRYSRLVVLRRIDNKGSHVQWICRCDCGKESAALSCNLVTGHTKSCGCWNVEQAARHGHAWDKNGKRSPEYSAYNHMLDRCLNANDRNYYRYGGRGIKVCERWREHFLNFLADMGPRPSAKHSLDRFPNNDGNYEPGNCRWATQAEQTRNTRRNRMITFKGETMCVEDWRRRLGCTMGMLRWRLDNWTVERALTEPKQA